MTKCGWKNADGKMRMKNEDDKMRIENWE